MTCKISINLTALFTAWVVLTLPPPADAANLTCDDTAIINLGFQYPAKFALAGVPVDLSRLRAIYGEAPTVRNLYLKTNYGGKKSLLGNLRKFIGEHKNIIFNYSGHGATENGYWSPVMDQDFIPATQRCARMEDENSAKYKDPGLKGARGGFLIMTPECLNCGEQFASRYTTPCYKRCLAKSDLRIKTLTEPGAKSCQQEICHRNCESASYNPELDKCYKEACITKDDLADLFKGKRVRGILDACHSGGVYLKDTDFVFNTSVDEQHLARDSREGGVMAISLEQACAEQKLPGSGLTPNDLFLKASEFAEAHSVFATGASSPGMRIAPNYDLGAINSECLVPPNAPGCRASAPTPSTGNSETTH